MLHILNNSGSRVEVGTLFLQPTWSCAWNCKGCYVKARANGIQTSVTNLMTLVKLFAEGQQAACNQITISLDVPGIEGTFNNAISMSYVFNEYIALALQFKGNTEFHVTVPNQQTLHDYLDNCGYDTVEEALRALNVISFSHIDHTDLPLIERIQKLGVHVNYNHMMPTKILHGADLYGYLFDLYVKAVVVDSVYLIMRKTNIGKPRNLEIGIRDRRAMASDLYYMKKITQFCQDKRVKPNIILDGCYHDTRKFLKSGNTCSANISKVTVWPDGSVSGCPYAHQSNTRPAGEASDILQNIKEAMRGSRDFNKCHLPEVYSRVTT